MGECASRFRQAYLRQRKMLPDLGARGRCEALVSSVEYDLFFTGDFVETRSPTCSSVRSMAFSASTTEPRPHTTPGFTKH